MKEQMVLFPGCVNFTTWVAIILVATIIAIEHRPAKDNLDLEYFTQLRYDWTIKPFSDIKVTIGECPASFPHEVISAVFPGTKMFCDCGGVIKVDEAC